MVEKRQAMCALSMTGSDITGNIGSRRSISWKNSHHSTQIAAAGRSVVWRCLNRRSATRRVSLLQENTDRLFIPGVVARAGGRAVADDGAVLSHADVTFLRPAADGRRSERRHLTTAGWLRRRRCGGRKHQSDAVAAPAAFVVGGDVRLEKYRYAPAIDRWNAACRRCPCDDVIGR